LSIDKETLERLEALEAQAERLEDGWVMRPHVSAETFLLLGEDGGVRMEAGPTPDGGTMLRQTDVAGRTRTCIDVSSDGRPRFGLFDAQGTTRLGLMLRPDGSPAVELRDEGGAVRLCLDVDADGAPAVFMLDAAGRTRAVLSMSPEGGAGLYFLDENGEPVR
jgi:hypothetical protein